MQFEAEVPAGMRPGQSFVAQTPTGAVTLTVPPGGVPGQRLVFTAPAPAPVVFGSVVGAPERGFMGARPMGARPYWTDPKTAGIENVPLLQGLPVEEAERKVEEIHRGAALMEQYPAFPSERRYQDIFWVAPFVAIVVAVVATAAYIGGSVAAEVAQHPSEHKVDLVGAVSAGAAGGVASLVAALGFALLAKSAPGCVVWTSLIFGPSLMMACGLALVAASLVVPGLLFIALGALSLGLVFCCYRDFIPFTIQVVEIVATVMQEKPMMVGVSVLGSILGMAWSLACGIAFLGLAMEYKDSLEHADAGAKYGILFAATIVFFWGAQVVNNVCHMAYCGVFGRWYHNAEDVSLQKSLAVALTTSFGSICFGSFLVAAVRALEVVIRQARRNAQEDGNMLCCVLLLVLECIVSAIGDILEYFSEWAYVQCAVRGVSFMDAARITYSMMTCANMGYVLSDLLINSVVGTGALLCGVVGCGAGAGVGFAFAPETAAIGAAMGFWAGLVAGGAAVGVLSSGTKTILMLWAEDAAPLRQRRPQMHDELERRIAAKME